MSTEQNFTPKRRSSAGNRRRERRAQKPVDAPGAGSVSTTTVTATASPATDSTTTEGRASRLMRRQTVQETVAEPQVPAPVTSDRAARNQARRDERRAAKAKALKAEQKRGVAKVVNTERMSGWQKFYHETMAEIRRVQWPDRETTINLTILVLALSAVLGLLLGGIDFTFLKLFEAIA